MKSKILMILAVFVFAVVGSTAQAKNCKYHQWRQGDCPGKCEQRVKAQPCEYYQWRWYRCPKHVKPAPKPQKLVLVGIHFDTGSATIEPSSYPILNRNVDMLKTNSEHDILIVGYTDNVGSETYNQKLSERRAESVKNYFITKGVDPSRIHAIGRGEANPVASNATASGRSQNRRIEVEFN